MKKQLFIIAAILIGINVCTAEKDIALYWCEEQGGQSEYRTINATYVDCLITDYAVEVEFDNKWKESIGQSLHYAQATGKKPAILYVRRQKSRVDYYTQLIDAITHHGLDIRIYFINEEEYS